MAFVVGRVQAALGGGGGMSAMQHVVKAVCVSSSVGVCGGSGGMNMGSMMAASRRLAAASAATAAAVAAPNVAMPSPSTSSSRMLKGSDGGGGGGGGGRGGWGQWGGQSRDQNGWRSVLRNAAMAVAGIGVVAGCTSVAYARSDSSSSSSSERAAEVTLYQYAVCPFCNKVRATLDYYNVPYRIVEVNPLLKGEIKWSKYKKVPIVTLDGEQHNNSSDIMRDLKSVYGAPAPSFFRMSKAAVQKAEKEEARWLKWVDDSLVHYLSPNIYRNATEAMQAFDYITKEGNFGYWEREAARYAGAAAMYSLVHLKLKKKYNIVNEREELYEKLDEFVDAIGTKRDFLGGKTPNLADIAVFGVIRAISGMDTFTDIMANTKLQPWYARMSQVVGEASKIQE